MKHPKRPLTRLKYERQRRGLTQVALAAIVDISQAYLSMIERGIMSATPEQLQKLSEIFGVPSADLLREVVIIETPREVPTQETGVTA